MTAERIKSITLTALFAAALAVLSQVSIPMPSGVPLTIQTFAVTFTGLFLGVGKGTAAVFVYILLGAAGLPVYSGFRSGVSALFGPTGGFIFGFLILTAICGLSLHLKKIAAISVCVSGLFMVHLCGIVWFSIIMKSSLFSSFLQVSLPFLLKDILSIFAAYFISDTVKKRINFDKYTPYC